MGSNIQGTYYSGYFTTGSVEGYDIMSAIETTLGKNITAKKLTYISSSASTIDINGSGTYSSLFADTDGYFKLSLDSLDCTISSLKVKQTSASGIFVAIVY